MRHYYTVDAIRAAEAPLLASLPDGALMRRAAYPLSVAVVARTGRPYRRGRRPAHLRGGRIR